MGVFMKHISCQSVKIFRITIFLVLFMALFLAVPLQKSASSSAQAQFFSGFAKFDKKKRYKKRRAKRPAPYYVSGSKSRSKRSRNKKIRNRKFRRNKRLKRSSARKARLKQARQKRLAQKKTRRTRTAAKKKSVFKVTRLRGLSSKRSAITSSATRKKNKQKRTRKPRNLGRLRRNPLQIVISIPNQSLKVFQGTKVIASSKISSGKAGHRTPTGVFSIIQKRRQHFSNIYNAASMPNMQRITWSGIALHAGRVPGYPASHGCIRLPHGFSKRLFRKTMMGGHVIVQNGRSTPRRMSHPMLFQPLPESLFANTKPQNSMSNWSSLAKTVTLVSSDQSDRRIALNSELFQLSSAKLEVEKRVAKRETLFQTAQSHKSESPLRIFITRSTQKEKIREIQKMLVDFGYDIGQPNGFLGRKTTSALYMLQDEENMDIVNGRITAETEEYLRDITGYHLKGNGHLYIRQNFKDLYDAPVQISDSSKALGTHIFTAQNFKKDSDEVQWVALTVKDKTKSTKKRIRVKNKSRRRGRRSRGYHYVTKYIPGKSMGTAKEALDRLSIEPEIRTYISRIITPGSSIMISHHGYSNETGKGTDFVVKVR